MRSLVLACVLVASTRADADPARAWAAAQANLPSSTTVVLGIDVRAMMSSKSLSIFAAPLIKSMNVNDIVDRLKACKIDPTKVVDGLVIVEGAKPDLGAYYFSVNGVDEAALAACASQLEATGKFASTWIGTDVFVIASTPSDKAMLNTFTSGNGSLAKTALGKLVAKTNTRAVFWAATTKPRVVQSKKMKSGHIDVTSENGTLTATIAMTFSSSKEAATVAKLANDQVIALLASGKLDALVMEMLNKASITTKAADVLIVGSVPDKELVPLIQAMTESP